MLPITLKLYHSAISHFIPMWACCCLFVPTLTCRLFPIVSPDISIFIDEYEALIDSREKLKLYLQKNNENCVYVFILGNQNYFDESEKIEKTFIYKSRKY